VIEARIRKQLPPGSESAGFLLDLEFRAAAGVTVLFGASGSGKTLTLDSIAGFVRPDQGRILLDGQILFDGEAKVNLKPRERQCGYVFQSYALFPHMTLRQNLTFAVERLPRGQRRPKVNEMLEKFRLTEVAGRRPHELSGGQKQRCSIARAVVGGRKGPPRALLLDEPAQGLDAPLRVELFAVLRQVREEFSTPILLVTHSLEECFALGDEMHVLRDGRLAQSGTPSAVLEQPANVDVARLLGEYNLLPVEIRALDPGRNISRLRFGDFDLSGPYFPGRLIGDHAHMAVLPRAMRAVPRDGKPAANQIPLPLLRKVDLPGRVRLEFAGDVAVEMTDGELEDLGRVKEWNVEFPRLGLRLL
jgi:molybdate transport system ATP-binding protein